MFCECCGKHDAVQVTWNEETEEYMCDVCLTAFKAEMELGDNEVMK